MMNNKNEIPEFILHGVDVLNELLLLIEYPNTTFQFSGEFLRRMKVNEDTIEDREQLLDIIVNYIAKFETIDVPRMQTKSCHDLLCYLCSLVIQQQLWPITTMKRYFPSFWPKFQHLLSPLCIFIHPNPVHPPSIEIDREVSLETISAITNHYAILLNKIKKLKELEKIRIKLLHENQELLQQFDDASLNRTMILQNMLDGVQLSAPSASSSSSSSAMTFNSPSTVSGSFTDEITEFRSFEKVIENEKILEDLFWRWIRKQQPKEGSFGPPPSHSSDILMLDSEIIEAKSKLQELLKVMEEEVMIQVMKQKIDIVKIQKQLDNQSFDQASTNDAILLNEISNDLHSSFDSVFSDELIARILNLGENQQLEADARGSIDEALVTLRGENHHKINNIIDISNAHSPFTCIVKDSNPQTF